MRYYWHAIIACFAQSVWLASAVDISRLLRRTAGIPSPISVAPSNKWDGDDGPWSTFSIQVGTPPQTLRVLVSTAGEITWTILPLGCSVNDISCTNNRGETFNSNDSSTWHGHDSFFSMTIEHNLNYIGSGPVGNDTLSLGTGPTLTNQAIGGLVATDFYLGMLGLNPRPTNSTTGGEGPASLITSLKAQNLIPSVTFGYTAGNQYRLNAVFGSLTLGGYDQSRFTPNNLSFRFFDNNYRDLMVGIQAISTDQSLDLLPDGGILAYVDSTVPHIWLPLAACQAFEKAFGLTYDNVKERYFVNSTTHSRLKATNANITFTLGVTQSGGDSINITLPYGSFDLTASWPESNDTSNEYYFPLRRAANVTQYTLGRTFLQEAYLIIDWERKNFSLSQCVFDEQVTNKQQLVAILPTDAVKVPSPSSSPAPKSSPSTGEIAGIVIGVIILLALLIGGFFLFKLKQRKKKNRSITPLTPLTPPPQDPLFLNQNEHSKGELATGREHERYELAPDSASKSPSAAWVRNEKPRDFDGGTNVFGVKDGNPTVHEMESPSLRATDAVELDAKESPKQLYGSEHEITFLADHHQHNNSPSPPYRSATESPVPRSTTQSPVNRSMGPSPLSQPSESPPTMHSVAARPGLHSRTSTMNSLPSVRHALPGAMMSSTVFPGPNRTASLSSPPVSPPVSPLAGGAVMEHGLGISEVLGGGEAEVRGSERAMGSRPETVARGVDGGEKERGDGGESRHGDGGGMI